MNAEDCDRMVSRVAAAIGEPARVRMLHLLIDGHPRTATELAIVANVSPSTASAHLNRLTAGCLVQVFKQGKHRHYSLSGPDVACAIEALNVVAGRPRGRLTPRTPAQLLLARTCYDHMAGKLGVHLHNCFKRGGWISNNANGDKDAYEITPDGDKVFSALGIDLEAARALRRRFAYACLDWSERQPHIGGALGAALLEFAVARKWVIQELDSRALSVTRLGKRELQSRFDLCF